MSLSWCNKGFVYIKTIFLVPIDWNLFEDEPFCHLEEKRRRKAAQNLKPHCKFRELVSKVRGTDGQSFELRTKLFSSHNIHA